MPAIIFFQEHQLMVFPVEREGWWVGLVSKLMPRRGLQEPLFRGHPQDHGKCPLNRLGFVNY